MSRGRAFAFVLLVALVSIGGLTVHSPVVAAQPHPAPTPSGVTTVVEDAALQSRTVSEAYNLLLDHYTHPLDAAGLSRAAWDGLAKEATAAKMAVPGPAPTFSGDRAADLETLRSAFLDYMARPDTNRDGFVAAHALIRGMVRYVDEGHTYFLDQQGYRDYQSWSRGENRYVGIGISISARGGEPRVVEVYEDTPARAAGLQTGDVIISIGDKAAAGMATDELTTLVRGAAGTPVNLVVRRGDDPTPLPFNIDRAEIHLQFVRQRVLDAEVGYVSLRGFPEPSVIDTLEQNVSRFRANGVNGLVLDLRGNSGGRIDVGTRLLGDFLPAGTSIYEEVNRGGDSRIHVTRPGASPHVGLPLVVLVDGGTASMGEIFAAAVQEHGAATVLGTQTSGSVAAAQVFPLPDGAGIQVTVFDILSSEGKPLNRVGVQPDEIVAPATPDSARIDDPVVARALEVLHTQLASAAAPTRP